MVKSRSRRSGFAVAFTAIVMLGALTQPMAGCAGGIPPSVERIAVRIAEDVCSEVLNDVVQPGGVTLRCAADDGKTAVTVVMPRAQWAAIKRASVDAGPGL